MPSRAIPVKSANALALAAPQAPSTRAGPFVNPDVDAKSKQESEHSLEILLLDNIRRESGASVVSAIRTEIRPRSASMLRGAKQPDNGI